MTWQAWLLIAIGSEVIATLLLRYNASSPQVYTTMIIAAFYILAFFGLSQVLKAGIGIGVAYAIWGAVGLVLVTLIGWILFGDALGIAAVVGIALILCGVLLIELGRVG